MRRFKARYVSDIKSIFLRKGEIYDVYVPEDDKGGVFFAVNLPDMDEPGDYAVPATRFEIVEKEALTM